MKYLFLLINLQMFFQTRRKNLFRIIREFKFLINLFEMHLVGFSEGRNLEGSTEKFMRFFFVL